MHSASLFFRRCGLLIISALLVTVLGCGSSPVRDDAQADAATQAEVKDLLAKADSSESPERDKYRLSAARILVDIGEEDWAGDLLATVDADTLFSDDFVDYTLLYSRIAIDNDSYFLAQRILTNPRVEQQWNRLPPEAVQTLRARRAELFALLGESADSVSERISMSALPMSDEQRDENQDALWQSLMTMPLPELQQRQRETTEPVAEGWYALASISKNNQEDIERQQAMIDQWKTQWPTHPASTHLPSDLRLLQQIVSDQPKVIGLLLPLSGQFADSGKAIRDGFMAAYYQAKSSNSRTPEIRVFDTNGRNINEVYDLAITDGAEAIIGPFFKDNVDELNLRLDLPVPTLALNTIDNQYGFPANLYQFGLPVEDEARQVAQRAWLEGHRNAMVLIQQSDTGKRAGDTFTAQWTELGGNIVQSSYFSDQVDYQDVVKKSLLISDSEERAKQIRQLLGGSIKFEEPRRRQDLDLIFMMARPSEAQLLKPTLNFHFASNIPVYATRHVYTGVQDSKINKDLNGIRFTTFPWWFDNNSEVKQAIMRNANPSPTYQQFYAMGVDTYRIYPRLKQLEQVTGAKFYGNTGALSMTTDRRLTREQIWVLIADSVATPLPTVVSDTYVE